MSELQIVLKSPDDIRPYENNPRHNAETVKLLKKAMAKYGFNQPIVIDKDGVIIKGHSRYQAAKELCINEIPCIISDNPDGINKADRIFDNRIHDLTKWDDESLRAEMRDCEGAINEILGAQEVDYGSTAEVAEVTEQAVEAARQKMKAPKQQELQEICCELCGYISYVDKAAIGRGA